MPAAFIVAALMALPTPKVALTPEVAAKLQLIAFQAAREDDTETVAAYLAAGQPANGTNTRGDTLLIVAAYAGSDKVVKLLLAHKGIVTDARNKMGLAALSAAAFKGHVAALDMLLKAKADPNAAGDDGRTALMFAALSDRHEAVKRLLRAGAKADAQDKAGNTPLSLAKAQGAAKSVALLEAARKR